MAQLSDVQLAALVIKHELYAPGYGSDQRKGATIMVAIAKAESGGNTEARNSSSGAAGLWQINPSAWPDLFKRYKWNNPDDNAEMAKVVLRKQGVKAWSAYTNGSYRTHIPAAGSAVQEAIIESVEWQGIEGPIDAIQGGTLINPVTGNPLGTPIGAVLDFLKASGAVLGIFVIGLVLLLIGAWAIFSRTKVGKVAEGVAVKAATKGAV